MSFVFPMPRQSSLSSTSYVEYEGYEEHEINNKSDRISATNYNDTDCLYDSYENNQFLSPPPNYLLCSICLQIVKNPLNLSCSHLFCAQCIHNWAQSHSASCPSCQIPFNLNSLTSNNAIIKVVEQLKVKCKYAEEGCKAEMSIGKDECDIKAHSAVCKYAPIQCSMCHQTLLRHELVEHEANYCQDRLINCQLCSLLMIARELTDHLGDGGDSCVNKTICHDNNSNISTTVSTDESSCHLKRKRISSIESLSLSSSLS